MKEIYTHINNSIKFTNISKKIYRSLLKFEGSTKIFANKKKLSLERILTQP